MVRVKYIKIGVKGERIRQKELQLERPRDNKSKALDFWAVGVAEVRGVAGSEATEVSRDV